MKCAVFSRKSLLLIVSFALMLVLRNTAWAGIQPEPFNEIKGKFEVELGINAHDDKVRGESKTEFTEVEDGFRAVGKVKLSREMTREKGELRWAAEADTLPRAYAGVVEALTHVFVPPNPITPGFTPALVEVDFKGNLMLSMEEIAEVGTWLASQGGVFVDVVPLFPASEGVFEAFAMVGEALGIPIHAIPRLRVGFHPPEPGHPPSPCMVLVTGADGMPVAGAEVFIIIVGNRGDISCRSVMTGEDGMAETGITDSDSGFLFAIFTYPEPGPPDKSLPVEFGSRVLPGR